MSAILVRYALQRQARRFLRVAVPSILMATLAGCALPRDSIRPVTESTGALPQDRLLANDWMQYRDAGRTGLVKPSVCGPGQAKTAFFVTLSGGGSRAAYFAARVLHELDQQGPTPLTQRIDGIFSVSGGSLTAALYGVSRELDDPATVAGPVWSETLTDTVLARPLAASMATELANPGILGPYLFGNLTRTDLLQRAIEKDILQNDGQALTFSVLNPKRPPVFIAATIATSEGRDAFAPAPFGSLFLFSKPDLTKLGIDWASVPLATAISASAAFPGLLSPVTLPRYRQSAQERQIGSPRYVHLIDGGNSDNLGLLGVKRALLENEHRLLRDCDSIVVLSVDAFGRQGFHSDLAPHEKSPVGWVFDHRSALASFDALLAANRARLLAEFKSRTLFPPGSEELCRKDGLSDDVCGGGVRADWNGINALAKKKLYFVHLNFDSPEMVDQTLIRYCKGAYGSLNPDCEVMPVDGAKLMCERSRLKHRISAIPTTFGLSATDQEDLRTFVSILNHPKNGCLNHLRNILANGIPHDSSFYRNATASCDETPALARGELPPFRGRIFGDVIPLDPSKRMESLEEVCQSIAPTNAAEGVEFLKRAKKLLIAQPQYLSR